MLRHKLGSPETVGLALAGGIAGVWKYCVKPEMTAERAWKCTGAAILAYELACPDGHTLSEGADRMIDKHPIATKLAIGITALHLANLLPPRIDPFTIALKAIKH